MPGTTAFPAALDTFPDIGPNTKENASGFEHDVVHNNEAAAIAALQVKVGVDGSTDPDSLDARVAAVESGKLDAAAVGSTVASLVGGKVPSAQLPSYVDDVIEVADFASLPATGETGKIYITLDDDAQYRWSGSAYVQLVASPGSTDAVPEGTTNLYFTDARAYAAVKAALQAGTHTGVSFAFNDGAHSISVTASGSGDASDVNYDNTASGLTADDVQAAIDEIAAGSINGAIGATFDGGGAVIATGSFVDVPVPFDCVIQAATLFGDPSGSLVVSVWACAAADYPPAAGDNIAGTAPPTLSSDVYSRDSTLTGWTVALAKGSVVRFKVQSCASIKRASLALEVIKF